VAGAQVANVSFILRFHRIRPRPVVLLVRVPQEKHGTALKASEIYWHENLFHRARVKQGLDAMPKTQEAPDNAGASKPRQRRG
jgi:hypothetical protein